MALSEVNKSTHVTHVEEREANLYDMEIERTASMTHVGDARNITYMSCVGNKENT